jgi:hypothetical protein
LMTQTTKRGHLDSTFFGTTFFLNMAPAPTITNYHFFWFVSWKYCKKLTFFLAFPSLNFHFFTSSVPFNFFVTFPIRMGSPLTPIHPRNFIFFFSFSPHPEVVFPP